MCMKCLAVLLSLLLMTAATAEGLFDGLLPDAAVVSVTPTPTPVPTPTPAPEGIPLSLLQEAFVACLGLPEIVETASGTVLRYTDVDLPAFAAFAAMISPEGLRLIQYDVAGQVLQVLIADAEVLPARMPTPADNDPVQCALCHGWGKCRTCWSLAELDCTACWDGSCRWCTDGYTYAGRGRKVDCSKCRGTDRCYECQGAGSFDCPECMAGECPACGGSGHR